MGLLGSCESFQHLRMVLTAVQRLHVTTIEMWIKPRQSDVGSTSISGVTVA